MTQSTSSEDITIVPPSPPPPPHPPRGPQDLAAPTTTEKGPPQSDPKGKPPED